MRLARGGIREHDAFLGEMRGPAGTGRGDVSMAGGWEGQVAGKGNDKKRKRKGDGFRGSALSPCLQFNRYHLSDSTISSTLV